MKILNFTATDILPALLFKTKTQTIRPAWNTSKGLPRKPTHDPCCTCQICGHSLEQCICRPARFNVGETIQLMWNQRSNYQVFCGYCGKGSLTFEYGKFNRCPNCHLNTKIFSKRLSAGIITDVFKIVMGLDENSQGYIDTEKQIDCNELAKKDGFKSLEHMMTWFDARYNLSQPKPFWVYRWEWKKQIRGDK